MVSFNLINIGSDSGLSPDGTKPLPEPMLTYHQQGPMDSSEGIIVGSQDTNQ